MRILIIDDDEVDRKAIARALKESTFPVEIHEAPNAQAGLALVKENTFDCMFLDYQLPDLDGLDVARELLKDGEPPSVPIVMLTGEGDELVAVEAMKIGVHDYLQKKMITTKNLTHAIFNAVEKVSLARKLHESYEQMKQLTFYDSLTGLGNHNFFRDQLDYLVAMSKRNNVPFSLFMMNLNKFNEINDTLGDEAGDQVIREVGLRLRMFGRAADNFYRLSGNEFAALVTTSVTTDGVEIMAKRLVEDMEPPVQIKGRANTVGFSIGIAMFPQDGEDEDTLSRKAKAAMDKANRGVLGYAFPPSSG